MTYLMTGVLITMNNPDTPEGYLQSHTSNSPTPGRLWPQTLLAIADLFTLTQYKTDAGYSFLVIP